MKNRIRLQRLLRRHGKDAFVASLPACARVFDIGCGNRSPERIKALRPDLYYIGLDIEDYAQSVRSKGLADEYRTTSSALFAAAIASEQSTMQAVVSSHNLEHCDDQPLVIRSMIDALAPGGRLYLAFPCEASVAFPSRIGSLRFSDDPTHKQPPNWERVVEQISQLGANIDFMARRYRPLLPAAIGAALEPLSLAGRRVMPGGSTWALWGFESVIWATKTHGKGRP